jgi:NADH dehydrogenase (ubiquinone) Fe-S protein 4
MSLLRPSIAGRLLRAGAPSSLRAVPSTKRYDTTTASGTVLTTSTPAQSSALVPEGGKEKDTKRYNQPDYAAEVDQASSYVVSIEKEERCRF